MRGDILAAAIRVVCGLRVQTLPNGAAEKPCIYFANHTSHLDFLLLWASLPKPQRLRTRPVAARDYWEKGRLRRYIARELFHAILIERQKVTVATNPLLPMQQALADGDSIIVFPEGTRSTNGEIGEFKNGLFHIFRAQPQAMLIPVYLDNLHRVLPKGEVLMVPLIAGVHFGAPLALDATVDKSIFAARARGALLELKRA